MLNTTCSMKYIKSLVNRMVMRFIRLFCSFKCQKSDYITFRRIIQYTYAIFHLNMVKLIEYNKKICYNKYNEYNRGNQI